jgi:hypothetical protein
MKKRADKVQVSVYLDKEIADEIERVAREYNNSMSGAGEYVMKLGVELLKKKRDREAAMIAAELAEAGSPK